MRVRTADILKKRMAAAVKRELKARGMPQARLGELVGVAVTHVNNILNGKEKGVSVQKLLDMTNALGLEVDVEIRRGKR